MRKLLVLLAAVAFVVAFTVPAIAADKSVSFYGQVWFDTFLEDDSKEYNTGYTFDDSDLRWDLNDNGTSRFGAKFKWDSMTANIEIRPLSASMYRQWWGSWNFGGGSLLVGHTWSPLYANATITNQSHAGGTAGGYGFWVGSLRQAQIRLTMGGLTVALVEPSASSAVLPAYAAASTTILTPAARDKADPKGKWTDLGPVTIGYNLYGIPASGYKTEFDTTLPKLEVTYALKLGQIALVPFLGWQSYDVVALSNDKSYSIDGMVYGITAKAAFGAGYVNAQVWMTKNGKEWGDLYYTGGFGAFYDAASDSIKDEDGMGYGITAGMKLSDTMKFEVGYGSVEYELDRAGTYEDTASAMYAQMTIALAKGFFLCPEIGVIDKGDHTVAGVKTEQGDMTYYGAAWKIYF